MTLRLHGALSGSRLLLRVDPSTLPRETVHDARAPRGQSTEASNAANRDQDFTLEVSSGSRTRTISASSPPPAAVVRSPALWPREDRDANVAPPRRAAR